MYAGIAEKFCEVRFLAKEFPSFTDHLFTLRLLHLLDFVVAFLHRSCIRGIGMAITTISSREFNQGASEAKRAATHGPVFITDRGRPAHVLMTFADYQRLTKQRRNIADTLAMPGIAGIEFEPPRAIIETLPADLS